MLSERISQEEAKRLTLHKYELPVAEQLTRLVEEKRRQAERKKIIDANADDPLAAAKREAHRMLTEAQDKLKAAEVDAQLLKVKAEQDTRQRLEEEYRGRLEQELQRVGQNFLRSLNEMGTLKDIIYSETEKDLLNLVFTITKKVIGDEIKTTPQIVVTMLKKGFEKLKEKPSGDIHIHPDDYDMLMRHREQLKDLTGPNTMNFVKDEAVERGGCKIISGAGEVSTEPGRQLEVIFKELRHGT